MSCIMRAETGGTCAFDPPRSRDELAPFDESHWLFPQNSIWVPRKLGPAEFFTVRRFTENPTVSPLGSPRVFDRLSENPSIKRARVIVQSRQSYESIDTVKCTHPLIVTCAYVISHRYFVVNRIKISNLVQE